MYQDSAEEELLSLLKAGNEAAFNEIYKRYWSGVFLVAKNRLRNDAEAEEIVQEIFCNLWRRRVSLVLMKNLKTYFAVAVKYEVINRMVKKKKENTLFERFAGQSTEEDLSTLQSLSFKELEERLDESVALLPERCQLVFKLRVEKEYSQKEIARELNISEKTVEAHLSKARKHIRTSFDSSLSIYLIAIFPIL